MSTLDELTDRLSLVCKLLDRAAEDVRDLEPELAGMYIRTLGEAMVKVFEVQRAIFAVRPDLEPAFLREKSSDPEADRRLTVALSEAYALVDASRHSDALALLRAFSADERSELHKRMADTEADRIERELKA